MEVEQKGQKSERPLDPFRKATEAEFFAKKDAEHLVKLKEKLKKMTEFDQTQSPRPSAQDAQDAQDI